MNGTYSSNDEFKQLQSDILTEDTWDNTYLPTSTRVSENKNLNTSKKNIIGAINEIVEAIANITGSPNLTDPTTTTTAVSEIKTVNNIKPDAYGNVAVRKVNAAVYDDLNQRIDTTYATVERVNDLKETVASNTAELATCVKSINGAYPTVDGAVTISTVSVAAKAVRATRDENGNNIANTYVTKTDIKSQLATINSRLAAIEAKLGI